MHWTLRRLLCPTVVTVGLAGLLVGGLLVGFEPVGGDPDRLYRPLKEEFARFLARGQLPLWSDRFGLGIPLLAESHVAAFYPPNWLIYSIAGISTAYRMAMWLHYLFLAAATYAYARFLRISPHGAAIAALAFTFCGFQAIHSTHEPFYHAMPYLTLAVLVAMVPLHRPLAGYHPAGRHLGRTVDARAFSVAIVDCRTGPAARNLESGA